MLAWVQVPRAGDQGGPLGPSSFTRSSMPRLPCHAGAGSTGTQHGGGASQRAGERGGPFGPSSFTHLPVPQLLCHAGASSTGARPWRTSERVSPPSIPHSLTRLGSGSTGICQGDWGGERNLARSTRTLGLAGLNLVEFYCIDKFLHSVFLQKDATISVFSDIWGERVQFIYLFIYNIYTPPFSLEGTQGDLKNWQNLMPNMQS
uniref:Uncharacterized protein n=1 Tax=Anolis carolinensis TaxID=28377 RepID=A0A803TNY6_ANOCA